MKCPSCQARLITRKTKHGLVFKCPECKGSAVTLTVLRKGGVDPKFVQKIWQKSREQPSAGRDCPLCGNAMKKVHTRVDPFPDILTLDVCPLCPSVWFDAAEFASVPMVGPGPKMRAEKQEMSPEAREQVALYELEKTRHRSVTEDGISPPSMWHWVPGLLGLPVEVDAPEVRQKPWINWSAMVLCILTTLAILLPAMQDNTAVDAPIGGVLMEDVYGTWGFTPADPLAMGGLTLVTSFFLHGGILHLLGNMYFMFLFGDNVEDRLGHLRFIMILFLAHGGGMFAEVLFGPRPDVPTVGASAGISGIIAFYAITFPHARLAWMFRYFLYWRWVEFSAITGLILYLGLQLVGVYSQLSGFGSVSYLGHLGGLVVGIIFALYYKYMPRHKLKQTMAAAEEYPPDQ